jgi:hypothetical protein
MKVCLELEYLVDNRIYCRIDVLNHIGITADRCTTDKKTMSGGYPVQIRGEGEVPLIVCVLGAETVDDVFTVGGSGKGQANVSKK